MKKKEILWERVPKTHLVIPVQGIKDQDSISTDELEVKQTEYSGLFGEDKQDVCLWTQKLLPVVARKKRGLRQKRIGEIQVYRL